MADRPVGRTPRGRLPADLALDLRFALRSLARNRTFGTVAALTIALGMGATAAMLSIGHAVLLRPAPVAEPDRMVSVWELRSGSVTESMEGRLLPWPRYVAYGAATTDVFSGLAGHAYGGFSIGTDDGAVPVDGFRTTGNYFDVLGLTPRLGRFYGDDEDAAVVLSERLWRARFGADPDVVGRTLPVGGRPYTVRGIAPADFTGTMAGFTGDVWLPARAAARLDGRDPDGVALVPIGRLRPGLERAVAQERVDAVARSIPPESSRTTVRGARLDGLLWRGDLEGVVRRSMAVMLGAAALLLLVACVNVASLMLARSYDRRREIAVRLAIGAGPGRLVRQLLGESVVLALVGGAGGIFMAWLGTLALSRIRLPVGATVTIDVAPDGRVLLVSFVVAAATGALFGLGPALRSAGTDLATSLKEGAQGPRFGRRGTAFVASQLAVSTLLLVTAGLFVRSFASVARVPLGFDPEGVLVAELSPGNEYGEPEARAFYAQVLERVRELPGVEAVGFGRFVLLGGSNASHEGTAAEGAEAGASISVGYNRVDPGWFAVNRIEPAEGRLLGRTDDDGAAPVAVVNRTLAERMWPGRSAIGRRFRAGGVEREVVGVVPDGVYVFQYESPQAFAFYPLGVESPRSLHVRSTASLGALGAGIRGVVRDLDPEIAVADVRTMEEVVSANRFGHRFIAWLTALFAGVALLIAAVGVYGLLAVQVARRGREFGVRKALGARTVDLVLLVIGRGAGTAVLGCLVGLGLALATGRVVASLLYQVRPVDALTFALVPAVLLTAAVIASAVPARRAARISAAATLREE